MELGIPATGIVFRVINLPTMTRKLSLPYYFTYGQKNLECVFTPALRHAHNVT